MLTLKALGALLTYPERELIAALPELKGAIAREAALPRQVEAPVAALIDAMAADDLLSLQERYVGLFDRSRGLSLHLFEHVHGDSRGRGPAMVELAETYRRHGLVVTANELPDYLPLFLEYLSLLPRAEAGGLLADIAHILKPLAERLRQRAVAYAGVFDALVALAGGISETLRIAEEEPDDTPEALDRVWEEAAVTFGPGDKPQADGGCARAAAIVARIDANP